MKAQEVSLHNRTKEVYVNTLNHLYNMRKRARIARRLHRLRRLSQAGMAYIYERTSMASDDLDSMNHLFNMEEPLDPSPRLTHADTASIDERQRLLSDLRGSWTQELMSEAEGEGMNSP